MRKTNLFYITGNDSNFLTFSNYGEYLTGVHLSTDHKIFPSKFLCFDLPFDSEHTLTEFKKFLMCYYENKLAVLRDYIEKNDENNENHILSLSYLLESILSFFNLQEINLVYYGDIVEQDYNGTYSDSICIVDVAHWISGKIQSTESSVPSKITAENNKLYNWDDDEYRSLLTDYYPIYDKFVDNEYNYDLNNYINDISLSHHISTDAIDKLQFNCIIPLFDVLNINVKTNINNTNDNTTELIVSEQMPDIYQNIPYGIWFYPTTDDGIDSHIILEKRDNYNQSWSLLLSSKFSPYPYGIKITDDVQKPIEQYTYAELLAELSALLQKYNDISDNYNKLVLKYHNLENLINSLEKINIDELSLIYENKLKVYTNNIQSKIDIINERLSDLKWKNIREESN